MYESCQMLMLQFSGANGAASPPPPAEAKASRLRPSCEQLFSMFRLKSGAARAECFLLLLQIKLLPFFCVFLFFFVFFRYLEFAEKNLLYKNITGFIQPFFSRWSKNPFGEVAFGVA